MTEHGLPFSKQLPRLRKQKRLKIQNVDSSAGQWVPRRISLNFDSLSDCMPQTCAFSLSDAIHHTTCMNE